MRWTAVAPVEWPSEAAWAGLWGELRAEIDANADDPDLYRLDEHGDGWQLVSGENAKPGSYYRFVSPRLTRARVAGRIDDAGALRMELAGVPLRKGPTAGTLVADGLDHPRLLTTNGQIGPLRWDASGVIADRELRARASLPWVQAEVLLREQGGALVLEVRGGVTGLTGPLLNLVAKRVASTDVQTGLDEFVADLASSLTQVARGEFEFEEVDPRSRKPGPPPDPSLHEFDGYVQRTTATLRRLQGEMDHRSWWGRRRSAWRREAEARLDRPTGTPMAVSSGESFRGLVLHELGTLPHRPRGQQLDEIVQRLAGYQRPFLEAPDFEFAEVEPPNYDQLLDLDWLATLRGAIRHLRILDERP